MALNISSDLVPQVINDYNAYTEDDLLIGLADEVTLPKIKGHLRVRHGHCGRSRFSRARSV